MKDSIVFPGFESFDATHYQDNSLNVLDPEINFPQFLEEARRYVKEKKQRQKEEDEIAAKIQVTNEEKKCRKKSWKNSFFSFWKSSSSHNRSNNQLNSKEISVACHNSKPRDHYSGPVAAGSGSGQRHQHQLSSSGPLAGLFQHKKLKEKKMKVKKGDEYELPYVSLDKLNDPFYDANKNYGPIYLVS